MLLQRAALTSSSGRPSRIVANAWRNCTVIRPQAILAHKCSPPRKGAGLAAPAPSRILIVPAISCAKHSGDSLDDPADSKAPAASQEQPADMKESAASEEEQPADKAPATSQGQPADTKAPPVFFGRQMELGKLGQLADGKPGVIRIVLGPSSCGKSQVFHEFQRIRENVLKVDMRGIDYSTPATFISAVLEELAQAAPRSALDAALERLEAATSSRQAAAVLAGFGGVVEGTKVSGSTADATFEAGNAVWAMLLKLFMRKRKPQPKLQHAQAADFTTVVQAIKALLDAWQQANKVSAAGAKQQYPMLIIDEANKLIQWQDTHPDQLDVLLSILIRISKQDGLCHVVVGTSEWGFAGWLQEAVGKNTLAQVIGDFPEEEARQFFKLELQRRGMVLEEATWEKVYVVGGGSAGFLVTLAEEAAMLQASDELNWDEALDKLAAETQEVNRKFADGGDALGWSDQQYAAAALELLRSQRHAVPCEEMELLLGQLEQRGQASPVAFLSFVVQDGGSCDPSQQRVAGRQVLRKMIAANALAVRPFSTWARDVRREAFQGAQQVVTAPSAVSLYCMRRLQQRLEDTVKATSK